MARQTIRITFSLVTILAICAALVSMLVTNLTPQVDAQPAPAVQPQAAPQSDFPVTITVDVSKPQGALKPIYRFFGADEPNYATMKDGVKLLGDIGALGPGQAFFRTHNLMNTGDGTPALKWGSTNMYTEDAQGNPHYDWTIVDQIFDAYLKNGVKPYAQIGFMPEAMSTHPQPYQHTWAPGQPYGNIYTGWSYPPKDYDKWRELVFQWVKHCVDKYGKSEVESWYWEVWNESNGGYWKGTPAEFQKLHDYAIDGVRRALPTAKVGGPDSAGVPVPWLANFLDHCVRGTNYATGKVGTPIDFVSFHAKGSPAFVDAAGQRVTANSPAGTVGHVRMGISNQLSTINRGFSIVASYPELKSKPIIIGECDPDGCAACAATVYPENGYRHTEQFASYTAACIAREHDLADKNGVNLEGVLTWAFEFENQPIWGGYRVMATSGGINVPAFNVFRMLGKMTGQRVAVESSGEIPLDQIVRSGVRQTPDVTALAALDGNKLCIMAWHYHDDYVPGGSADISMTINGLPATAQKIKVEQFRIDHDHSNAYTAWQNMGSPKEPTAEQTAQLVKAGNLAPMGPAEAVTTANGSSKISLKLPRQGVALLVLSW